MKNKNGQKSRIVIFQLTIQELEAKRPRVIETSHTQTLQPQESTISWWESMREYVSRSYSVLPVFQKKESKSKPHENPNC